MKTLKSAEGIIRKSDSEAHELVKKGAYSYCPKSEFKGKASKVSKPVIKVEPKVDATLEALEAPKTGYKGKAGRGDKAKKDAYRAKKKGKVIDVKPAG